MINNQASVSVNNLSFSFGRSKTLDDVSLIIPSGSIYGLLGPNGAGKTTLLKLLCGLLKPDTGSVRVFGKPLPAHRKEVLRNTGVLIESPALYPFLTGWQNLETRQKVFKLPDSRLTEVLEFVGLRSVQGKKVKTYSFGMKQRLGIAMALLHNPELLLLDEPVNGLDPEGIRDIRVILQNLRREGKTIVISSHLLSEADKICDTIGVLLKGTLVYSGPKADMVPRQKVRMVRGGDPQGMAAFLEGLHYKIVVQEEWLQVIPEKQEAEGALVRLLAAQGFDIYEVYQKEYSLEDLYLQLSKNKDYEPV